MILMLKTTSVNTHTLTEGDYIFYYGEIMRLKDRKSWPMRKGNCPETQGECITFKVDFLTDGDGIPKSWRHDWTVQGNGLANWSRIDHPELIEQWIEQQAAA